MADNEEGKRNSTNQRVVDNKTPEVQEEATMQISATELQAIRNSVSSRENAPSPADDGAGESTKSISRSSIADMLEERPPGATASSSVPGQAVLKKPARRKREEPEASAEPATSPKPAASSPSGEPAEAEGAVDEMGFSSQELIDLSDAVLNNFSLEEDSGLVPATTDDYVAWEGPTDAASQERALADVAEPGQPENPKQPESFELPEGLKQPDSLEQQGSADYGAGSASATPEQQPVGAPNESSSRPARAGAAADPVTPNRDSRAVMRYILMALSTIAGLGMLSAGIARFVVYDWLPAFHPLAAGLLVGVGLLLLLGAWTMERKARS